MPQTREELMNLSRNCAIELTTFVSRELQTNLNILKLKSYTTFTLLKSTMALLFSQTLSWLLLWKVNHLKTLTLNTNVILTIPLSLNQLVELLLVFPRQTLKWFTTNSKWTKPLSEEMMDTLISLTLQLDGKERRWDSLSQKTDVSCVTLQQLMGSHALE